MALFAPVAVVGGHNNSVRAAPAVGTVDELELHDEGWAFRGSLADPAWVVLLRAHGELPLSAEYRAWPDAAPNRSDITWPAPAAPRGVVVAVAVLHPMIYQSTPAPSCGWIRPSNKPAPGEQIGNPT